MPSTIRWSRFAGHGDTHLGILAPCGYIEQALQIFRNPQDFSSCDHRKATNILRAQKMPELAQSLENAARDLWLARRESGA